MIDQILCMHDGKPQWRNAGNWGLLTWDHRLPGVIIGNKMYVLKLSSDYASFPTSGIAEIRVRDISDRVNHTFTTYAKLNQIASDGNLTQDAYIFTDGTDLYYSGIVTWYRNSDATNYAFTPTKTVLYRLDSVDSSNVGVFTLVETTTLAPTVNANKDWAINGHPSFSWTDNGYYWRYSRTGSQILFNETRDLSNTTTYTDDFGSMTAYVNEIGDSEYFLSPYTSRKTSRKVIVHEDFTPRGFKVIGGAYSKILEFSHEFEWVGISNTSSVAGESPSADWNVLCRPVYNGIWPWLWKNESTSNPDGLFIPHPVTFSNNWSNDTSRAWGLAHVADDWIPSVPSGTVTTRSYVLGDRSDSLELFDMPTFTPSLVATSYDAKVGIWGACDAVIWRNASVVAAGGLSGVFGVDYTDFYVIKGSDTANANRYSIFSGVEEDGGIIHIEGLEDPTPTLWIDNTFVGNLN